MFESLKPVAIDPILGLMIAFKADPRSEKIDLGVGVYQDDRGRTPRDGGRKGRRGTAYGSRNNQIIPRYGRGS